MKSMSNKHEYKVVLGVIGSDCHAVGNKILAGVLGQAFEPNEQDIAHAKRVRICGMPCTSNTLSSPNWRSG